MQNEASHCSQKRNSCRARQGRCNCGTHLEDDPGEARGDLPAAAPALARRWPELGSYIIAVPVNRYRHTPQPDDRLLARVGWRYLRCVLVDGRVAMIDGAGRPTTAQPELLIVQSVRRFD